MFSSAFAMKDQDISLWRILREEAACLARREPQLSHLINRVVLSRDSFADSLSELLSEILASTDVPKQMLRDQFLGACENDQTLIQAANNDLIAVRERDPACSSGLCAFLNLKGYQGLQSYRLAHSMWQNERPDFAFWIANQTSRVLGLDIHPAAKIGSGVMLDHGSGIVIGETAVIENNVSILQNVTLGGTGKVTGDRHPKVREGVMIGAGAKVIGNIEIGAHAKVAAGSVVLKDVPANCTAAGIPAQIVRIHNIMEHPAHAMDQKI